MSTTLRRITFSLLFTFGICSQHVQADLCSCDGSFYIGAEYLYFKPYINNLSFALKETDNTSGLAEMKTLCPDWDSGFRVFAGYESDDCVNWGLRGSYTYFSAEDSGFVDNSNNLDFYPVRLSPFVLQIAVLGFDEIDLINMDASYDLKYHHWDALLSMKNQLGHCSTITSFIGLAGLNFDQNFDAVINGLSQSEEEEENTEPFVVTQHWNSKYEGTGIKLGAVYQSVICDCWNAYVLADGSLLYGKSDNFDSVLINFPEDEDDDGDEIPTQSDEPCLIVPGYRVGLGISYQSEICNCMFSFKLGYEFGAWYNIPNNRSYVEGISFIPFSNLPLADNLALSGEGDSRTFGYHGVTLGVALGF